MNQRTITNICAIPSALFLLLIGVIHSIVNFNALRRAIARGEIAARLGDAVLFNAVFSGLFISLFGLVVMLLLPGLQAGNRQAVRVAAAIGILISLVGIVGYIRVPTKPTVLIFLFFGVLLLVPILIWRRPPADP